MKKDYQRMTEKAQDGSPALITEMIFHELEKLQGQGKRRYYTDSDVLNIVIKYLAELEDKIENGTLVELQNEWISVEERLPETDNENTHTHKVLVYIPQREGTCQHGIFLGKLKEVKADDGSMNFWGLKTEASEWTVWGWSYFEHPIVTHWKPIPTPHKAEAKAKLRELQGYRK